MAVHVRTMNDSLICKNRFRMGYMTLSRVIIISCEMLCRTHFSSISIITLICSSRVRVDGRGGVLLLVW